MTNEIKGGGSSQVFDYKEVDEQTADFLREKERNIKESGARLATYWGEQLKEAQDTLSKPGSKYEGIFGKWCEDRCGISRNAANRLINRYDLVIKYDGVERELIEALPKTLSEEIARPNSESSPAKAQAKSEVLAGNIDTLKAYRERIAELERENERKDQRAAQAERQADIERKQRERLEEEVEHLSEREPEIRYETKTEYIEVGVEEPYNRMNDEPFSVERGNEFYSMMREIDELYKKYAHLKDSVEELRGIATYDDDMKLKYRKADEFWRMIGNIFRESNTNIIDVEII